MNNNSNLNSHPIFVYIVMTIDTFEIEYISAVFTCFEDAKIFLNKCQITEFICDAWIEKHEVISYKTCHESSPEYL